ncbi:MAG: hypothetical protein GXN96_05915 [Aquificae bacterium]|nr:hypothetical protein [Aquificota bacterium]
MRVKFRIEVLREGKKVRRSELTAQDPFTLGLRYLTEFKYLEATKWLQLAPDSYEKYYLLGLISEALGQEEEAREFYERAEGLPPSTPYAFRKVFPSRNTSSPPL